MIIDRYKDKLKEYCLKNRYDFDRIIKLPRCGNEKVLFIQRLKNENSGEGLKNDKSPAEVVLTVRIADNGTFHFEKGKNIDDYLIA